MFLAFAYAFKHMLKQSSGEFERRDVRVLQGFKRSGMLEFISIDFGLNSNYIVVPAGVFEILPVQNNM